MKGLSLHQPWASLMAIGAKRIETRSWRTDYAGPVLIHATKAEPAEARELVTDHPAFAKVLSGRTADDLPRGKVIAIARLLRCSEITEDSAERLAMHYPWEHAFGDYTPGRIAWVFDRLTTVPPFHVGGDHRGLWKVDEDGIERLRLALGPEHPLLAETVMELPLETAS